MDLTPSKHPAANPAITSNSMESAAVGRESIALGREQLQFAKDRSAQFDPEMIEAIGLENDIARENRERSASEWDRYQSEFVPVENRMIQTANEWDSDSELDRAAQEAGAGVSRSFGDARDQQRREMGRMGINPNSGKYGAADLSAGLSEAAAQAGAETGARDKRRLEGAAMREGVAKFGRGLTSSGIAADNLALAGAQSQANTANMAVQSPLQARSSALPFFNTGLAGINSGTSSLLGLNQQELGAWNARQQRKQELTMQGMDFLYDMGGMAIGGMMSSEDFKEDKSGVSEELILEGLQKIPVEQWKYKKGMGDGGRHVGPYAEDMQEQFGDGVAPGGKMIDIVSMNGLTLAAIKALAKKVSKLEKNSGGLEMARAKRDTEPRRVS